MFFDGNGTGFFARAEDRAQGDHDEADKSNPANGLRFGRKRYVKRAVVGDGSGGEQSSRSEEVNESDDDECTTGRCSVDSQSHGC